MIPMKELITYKKVCRIYKERINAGYSIFYRIILYKIFITLFLFLPDFCFDAH